MTAIISASVPHRFSEDLNFSQYAAVTHPGGPVLVAAGPGTGKTRVLTYRVAWMLDQGVSPSAILMLTFSSFAAQEMLSRAAKLAVRSSKSCPGAPSTARPAASCANTGTASASPQSSPSSTAAMPRASSPSFVPRILPGTCPARPTSSVCSPPPPAGCSLRRSWPRRIMTADRKFIQAPMSPFLREISPALHQTESALPF